MKRLVPIIVFLFGIGTLISLHSQELFRANRIRVFNGTHQLLNPFVGGLNAPVINRMDLNNDGKLDLVLVNNYSYKISTFINSGKNNINTYTYEPKYESYFPRNIQGLFILRDMTEDGFPELILESNPYYLIYKGTRLTSETFQFAVYDSLKSLSYDPLRGPDYVIRRNNYLPIIQDLDHDGDVDYIYISNNPLTSSIYNKNMKKELNLPSDKNLFYKQNVHWGQHFYSLNPLAFVPGAYSTMIKGMAPPQNPPLTPRHDEYQMLWELDADNDNRWDVVAYSENQKNGPLGLNRGTQDSAFFFNQDTFFPSYSKPISKFMPFGTWTDLDNDGKNDILSTSLMERDMNSSVMLSDRVFNDDINCLSIYKNFGPRKRAMNNYITDSFGYQTDSFLSSEMIDVGTNSSVIFYDVNGDSLLDMIVPNLLRRDSQDQANITLYLNIGTSYAPRYKFESSDFFQYKSKKRGNIHITKGDLDGDGEEDLLISSYDILDKYVAATQNQRIQYDIYYKKVDATTRKVLFLADTLQINSEGVFGISNLCLYDVDGDKKQDLFIGDYYHLRYFRNLGTTTRPSYPQVTDSSVIDKSKLIDYPTTIYYYPAVQIDKSDGKLYLYFSYYSEYSKIAKAAIDTALLNHNKPLTLVSKNMYNLSLNKYATISFSDINRDGYNEMAIGNYAGGVQLFSFANFDSSERIDSVPSSVLALNNHLSSNPISFYPNPANDVLNISVANFKKKIPLRIYAMDGKLVYNDLLTSADSTIDISSIPFGVYFIQYQTDESHTFTDKLVIIRD